MDDEQPQDSPVASGPSREHEGMSDDDGPIDPGALSVDLDVAEELFGARYLGLTTVGQSQPSMQVTGTTAHGPTQLGAHNTMHNNYYGEKPLDPIIGVLSGVDGLLAVYAPTDADATLDASLVERSTLCLLGPRNSGRFSTAVAALARRYGPWCVHEVVLPTGVPPERLIETPDLVAGDSGFVLRLAEDDHLAVMRKLTPMFRGRHSSLLLIKEGRVRRWDRHGGEVSHCAPDPFAVFHNHLGTLPQSVQLTVDESRAAVDHELKATYGPKECVALAAAVKAKLPSNSEALHAILQGSQPKRRERASNIMLPKPDDRARLRRTSQHERAFRLAYAVFRRRPLHYVFEAADLLLNEIDSAALRSNWGSMALQHPVQELLGEDLKADWVAASESGTERIGSSRTAWIRDPGLRGAIIDVAWHDFDGTRRPLLKWLDRLVRENDEVMQRAAAEAAGLLADLDFARVYKELIDDWAKSPRRAVRQAAAWALTYSAKGGDAAPKVRAKLREWCSGNYKYQHDTAARVYASGLEQTFLAWSMLDLLRIAEDPMQEPRHAVAAAVNQLYRPERAGWILDELAGWPSVAPFRVHVARAAVALTARIESTSLDGRPDLLQRIVEGQIDSGGLGRLWSCAFFDPVCASEAGATLASWIRYADGNDDVRVHVVALLDAMISTAASRRRITFYLTRAPEIGKIIPKWVKMEGKTARER
ncbi:hypothetical protein [Actinoplanes sp. NPDC020271]|uniref:hypothetical protein n=1 Tax=Actinoplanes sp. NPDC020271 TaxID=3363896 RepID=UPI0037B5ADA1